LKLKEKIMDERVNLGKTSPEAYQAVIALDRVAVAAVADAGLTHGLGHLLKLRASQINQCAFCVRMHSADALKDGETPDRLSVLPAWRETGYFTTQERAALALTEAITLVAQGQVPDDVYEAAAVHLTPAQISAVEWLAVVINAWNRIAISSRYHVAP
jgi:AhpD family alkylhydroperoxidase